MRIRVWNAFASNNSGSYTIVGVFEDEATAEGVARDLGPIFAAHSAWAKADGAAPSPLEEYAKALDLPWNESFDHWPQYGGKDVPDVVAVDTHVLVHHEYTVTLPRLIGQLFYARGGRVKHELDHSHGRLVAVIEAWWLWTPELKPRIPELGAKAVALLTAPDGPLARLAEPEFPVVCRFDPDAGHAHAPLLVAAVFRDLAEGFVAVSEVLRGLEARVVADVHEATSETDPTAPWRSRN